MMTKRFISAFALLILATSCLKHDVLKQEAVGNFRESAFYESGDFDKLFDVVISDIDMTQTSNGTTFLCKPVFTITLSESYRNQLAANWEHGMRIKVRDSKPLSTDEVFESGNFSESFRVEGMSSVECGDDVVFSVRLELITPTTSVIAAIQEDFTISTP